MNYYQTKAKKFSHIPLVRKEEEKKVTSLQYNFNRGVRSNVTLESLQLIKQILEDYPDTFTEEDLENTKSFLLKSNARSFETLGAKMNILQTMITNDWDADYITRRQQIVRDITLDEITRLARTFANPGRMVYVVVGDARTQLPRLRQLGFGEPVLVN